MRSLFVMDPLERINVAGDSTYVTMRECTDRGFSVSMCTPDALYARDGRARVVCRSVVTTREAPHFQVGPARDVDTGEFDIVWMRKDPPFDMSYVFTTYLLDMVPAPTVVVNGSRGLKQFNEKMWVVMSWPHLQPPTLVSNDIGRLCDFVRDQPGRSVLKPWDGNGGRGVVVTAGDDRNLRSLAEILTSEGRQYAIAQAYVPEVELGDKRIILFDGEPVGAMLRVPQAKDFRANMHAGGTVQACELDPRDRQICDEIGPSLREHGMLFVGIDVIGPYLTEINVTSPTGLQEIGRLNGVKLEADLVDRAVARTTGRERRGA
ncbi:MAG: glutathione synthase [Myxococcota bacterium]